VPSILADIYSEGSFVCHNFSLTLSFHVQIIPEYSSFVAIVCCWSQAASR